MEPAGRADVTARAGLPLVVETLRALGVDEVAGAPLPPPQRQRGFAAAHKLEARVTLLAAGGERVEDVRGLAEDQGLEKLRGAAWPSPDALLDCLGQCHDPRGGEARPPEKRAWVAPESAGLRALDAVNRARVARGADRSVPQATSDHDGTISEAHARDATVAYEATRGFQPRVAVWAEQDLVVADEFRDGHGAGGENPVRSVERAFATVPAWVGARRFRADSAAYYAPRLKYLVQAQIGFAISADLTQALRAGGAAGASERWARLATPDREPGDLAAVEFAPGDWPRGAWPLRDIALRCTPLQGEPFESQGVTDPAVVPKRDDLDAAQLGRWHREKADTIEPGPRGLKDELGAGVRPSARFGANAAWFRINALTFNGLSVLKRRALPERFRDARPKRLRDELFTLAGELPVHQSQLSVRGPLGDQRLQEIVDARGRLLAMDNERRGA